MAYYFTIDSGRGSAVTKLEYHIAIAATLKVTNTWVATFHS